MLKFQVDKEKVLHALLFLIGEANARRRRPSQYDLLKTIFLADRAHLNKYGRPITFDKYVAMANGPVPSFAYDMLKPSFNWTVEGRYAAPWSTTRDGKANLFTLAEVKPDLRKLSASDREFLSDSLGTVLTMGFSQIKRLTHGDRAYVQAWRDEDGAKAFPMNMELFLDDASEEALDDVRYLAEMKK